MAVAALIIALVALGVGTLGLLVGLGAANMAQKGR